MIILNSKSILLAEILLISLILLGCGKLYHEPEANIIKVTGTLLRVSAIGGETTGWGVELDSPLEIEEIKLHLLEIVPYGIMQAFENRRIEITGTLQMRYGVERKRYWVIIVNNIRLIE